jgi:hypothetical protein
MRRYRKLRLALSAIASLYIVRATGLDQGLIDEALRAAVEAVTEPEVAVPAEGSAPAEVVPQ